jgi:hypothetical protein
VHPAALPSRADEHRGDGFFETEVMIGDHQRHAAQAAGTQPLEERRPEGAVLAVADLDTQHLPVTGTGDTGGHHDSAGDDPPPDPALQVGSVREHVREPGVVEAAVAESVELPVELSADPRHLALGDPRSDPKRLDQVVDLAGRHAVHVRLHHHREQGPIDPAAPLEQAREERALPQLRDRQLDIPGLGVQDPLQTLADGVGHLARLQRGEQFGQVRLSEGHRRSPLRDPG